MNNKNLFLTLLDDGKGKIKVWSHSGEAIFLVYSWCFRAVSSHGGRGKVSLWSLFYKGNNPIHEGSALMT